jgi:hypothetical protein
LAPWRLGVSKMPAAQARRKHRISILNSYKMESSHLVILFPFVVTSGKALLC